MANRITQLFGSGGAGLTPNDSQGTPALADILRGVAEDLRAVFINAALATPATRKSANETYNMSGGKTLTLESGGVQKDVVFEDADFATPAAATAAEVAAVLDDPDRGHPHIRAAAVAGPAVELYSDEIGASSELNVIGGDANAVLTFTTGSVNGTGTDLSIVRW